MRGNVFITQSIHTIFVHSCLSLYSFQNMHICIYLNRYNVFRNHSCTWYSWRWNMSKTPGVWSTLPWVMLPHQIGTVDLNFESYIQIKLLSSARNIRLLIVMVKCYNYELPTQPITTTSVCVGVKIQAIENLGILSPCGKVSVSQHKRWKGQNTLHLGVHVNATMVILVGILSLSLCVCVCVILITQVMWNQRLRCCMPKY